jgi:hypothetical protein
MGAYFNYATSKYEPLFGAQNAIRVPAFTQLDARLRRTFTLTELRQHLRRRQNVTDRRTRRRSSTTSTTPAEVHHRPADARAVVGARVEL